MPIITARTKSSYLNTNLVAYHDVGIKNDYFNNNNRIWPVILFDICSRAHTVTRSAFWGSARGPVTLWNFNEISTQACPHVDHLVPAHFNETCLLHLQTSEALHHGAFSTHVLRWMRPLLNFSFPFKEIPASREHEMWAATHTKERKSSWGEIQHHTYWDHDNQMPYDK